VDPVTLLTAIAIASGTAAISGGIVAAVARAFRKEWNFSWNGRKVRLVAGQNRKELYVDGVRVAHKTTLSGMGTTLVWTMESGGPPVVVTASIAYPSHAPTPVGRVYANGQWIGGDPREPEAAPPKTASIAPAANRPEPTDTRWEPAKQLLADLSTSSDPRVAEAAERIDRGLRDVLGRLDRLAAAREAHAALGGDGKRLDAARARLDAQVQEVVEALREVHLVALAGGPPPSLDRVEDLVGRVEAEAEVDDAIARGQRLKNAARERS
jgi:hypothetical protein